MIYLFDSIIPEEKTVVIALTYIYGIKKTNSELFNKILGFSKNIKLKNLTNTQLNSLVVCIKSSKLLLGNNLKKFKSINNQKLVNIRSFRGLRKKQGLPIRGQRTHSNAKTSRKKF